MDLGCGGNKRPGYYGIDVLARPGIDIQCDLDHGIPLMTNCVDRLNCSHFLEHVDDLIFMLGEIYRVCKPGARLDIAVPYYMSEGAFGDPTHKHWFNERTFRYFDPGWDLSALYGFPFRFAIKGFSYEYSAGGLNRFLKVLGRVPSVNRLIRARVWNYVYEMQVVLEVVK